jgi:myo-inositol-1(or 4)-monophosphatase
MHPMLNTAVKAARKGASIINRASLDLDLIRVSSKGRRDFVTEVDRAAEDAIISILRTAYPSHAFLAEESSAVRTEPKPEYLWIIDPLDGTTNFIHGFPQYAVSIALEHRGQLTQGVVYDPTNNELFTASRGRGAFLNDRRLRVSRRTRLDESLIGTGLPFRAVDKLDHYLAGMRRIVLETAGVRRAGSAALDLAYVAAGRLDGFWEYSLSPWDIAAGALLVIESGGLISEPDGGSGYLDSGHVVCGNPKIHAGLLELLADAPGGEAKPAESTPAPAPPPAPAPAVDASGTLSVNAAAAPRRVSRVRRSAT